MANQFVNRFRRRFAVAVGVGDTTITLEAGAGAQLPAISAADPMVFVIGLDNAATFEVVLATNRVGDVLTVVRGQEGTAAQAWANLAITHVQNSETAGQLGGLAPKASPIFTGQPTIPNFTNAQHNHSSAATGGAIPASSVTGLFNQTIEDEGAPVAPRATVNFTGAGVSVADAGGKTVVTIPGGGVYTDEQAQDAVGAMVDASLTYVDATPLLQRAALTGDVTAVAGSNATTIANGAVTYVKMQNVSAASRLLGRGDGGAGVAQEITLGAGLTMTGTTLSASGGAPPGANTQIIFNDNGAFGAAAGFVFDRVLSRLGVGTGSPTSTADIRGVVTIDTVGEGAGHIDMKTSGVLVWSLFNGAGGQLRIFQGGVGTRHAFDTSGNFGLGATLFQASMTRGLTLLTGVAPTGNVADQFAMYSADQAAGNACPHFRTELGDVVKLFKSTAHTPTNVTTDRSYDANATTLDEIADVLGTLIADLQATGLIG